MLIQGDEGVDIDDKEGRGCKMRDGPEEKSQGVLHAQVCPLGSRSAEKRLSIRGRVYQYSGEVCIENIPSSRYGHISSGAIVAKRAV